ncbi:hypothetical protein [Streptomyces canus]|uniref:hypothetical protein n=1 Tax=Streptomyces canus TaxID=58343 RepID=UPI003CEAF6F0
MAEVVRRLPAPGGVWLLTTPLTGRLPEERRSLGLAPEDVATVTGLRNRSHGHDPDPGGMRCCVLRA